MQLEVGKIYEGKITGITKFGAFVELDAETTGMVHISEVANTFVNEIKDHIQEGQVVKVKVLTVGDDKKISLSIKKAQPPAPRPQGGGGTFNNNRRENDGGGFNRDNNSFKKRPDFNRGGGFGDRKPAAQSAEPTFEDMLSKFKQNSEEKMSDLKKSIDGKRRGGGRRPGGKG